jgi:hypothetical protein
MENKDDPFQAGETLFLKEQGLPSAFDRVVTFERYDGDFALVKLFNETKRVPITSLRRPMPVW